MTEEDELKVIRRVLDGEIDAFEILVTTYQDSLIRMLATLLHDHRRLAEDIAQDVLVEAFRRLRSYDPCRSRFSTWLFMIARSRGINALNKKRPVLAADPPRPEASESNRVAAYEDLKLLDEAVHLLPPKQKRAFVLAVIEELPYAEIARIEGATEGTIKSRVSRARDFLKVRFSERRS